MQNFKFTNGLHPVTGTFNGTQELQAEDIKDRMTATSGWGIVRDNTYMSNLGVPVSSLNSTPNRSAIISEFPIEFLTSSGELNIGQGSTETSWGGCAFNINGDIISIKEDVDFVFDTDIPQGKRSSGNLRIPLTVDEVVGTPVLGTYFIWAEYLEIQDNDYPVITASGVDDYSTSGGTEYPKKLNGYKIVITDTAIAPSSDGVSVFLAKVTWAVSVGGSLNIDPSVTQYDD